MCRYLNTRMRKSTISNLSTFIFHYMKDNFVILLVHLSQHTFIDLLFVSHSLRFPKHYTDNHLPWLIFLEITDASEMNSYCV